MEKVTSVPRPQGGEQGGYTGTWGKSLPDRGVSQCKGPEAGVHLRNSEEACVTRGEDLRERVGE